MVNQKSFKNKNITIVGLGRSGFACATLLHSIGALVSITEKDRSPQVVGYAQRLPTSIKYELGNHTSQFIWGRDLIVVSPGVDSNSKPLIWAREFGIPVIGELECAWRLCPGRVIAITGTNGKTTTTTLIGRMIEASGQRVFVLGNIGTPFSAQVYQIRRGDFVVLEVSSFQLETIEKFKPNIAVILNFTPDHLDRYSDLSAYLSAKSRIFMNQDKGDFLVLNREDPIVSDLANSSEAKVVYFDSKLHVNLNFAAAKAVASILGIGSDLCERVFLAFKGLPHRLERVGELESREFINDSKATNPQATVFALQNINKPVILIAGGRDKGFDFSKIRDFLSQKIKSIILIGETKEKMRRAFEEKIPTKEAPDLLKAVETAFSESKRGDCILFSPMCSSFDMFRDYEHRGDIFKSSVIDLMRRME